LFVANGYDMELSAVEMWNKNDPECKLFIFQGAGHCVNMNVPLSLTKYQKNFGRVSNPIDKYISLNIVEGL